MNKDKNEFLKFIFSPFIENDETIKIKKYARELKKIDDFKDLSIYFVEYNSIDKFKTKLKLVDISKQLCMKSISIVASTLPYLGIYNNFTKNILILVDNGIKYSKINNIILCFPKVKIDIEKSPNSFKRSCTNILKTMYHEKKHLMQHETKDNSFESILYQMEIILKLTPYGVYKYLLNHDGWFFEIDANNYGVNKSIEYYNKTLDDHIDIERLKELQKIYSLKELMYNFNNFFALYSVYNKIIPFYSKYKSKLSSNKGLIWHEVFYDDNGNLKSIENIISNPLIDKVDPKFVNFVLTSKYFNKNIDYDKLDYDIVCRLLIEFQKRLNEINSKIQTIKIDVDKDKKMLKRIKNNIEYYETKIELLQSKVNQFDNIKNR